MDLLKIYNTALSFHNNSVNSLDEDSDVRRICDMHIEAAKIKVLREYSWSFFIKKLDIDYKNTISGFGYDYGFKLPSNLIRNVKVEENGIFSIFGNVYYTNTPFPRIYGILSNCFDEYDYPPDLEYLISCNLAVLIASQISPGDNNIKNTILEQYSWTTANLIENETQDNCDDRYGVFYGK